MRVLIVENNAELAGQWQWQFTRDGLNVELAQTRSAAQKSIRFFKPDVIVLNLAMPDAAALTIADFAAYTLPDAKVVFVTRAGYYADGLIFSLAANACACVPETIAPDDLAAMVEHFGAREMV
ncbi:MAG: response regulator [Alphaproteobacteria bacterium]|nr:response regulator [Alphaproteobacteria bacterium]